MGKRERVWVEGQRYLHKTVGPTGYLCSAAVGFEVAI